MEKIEEEAELILCVISDTHGEHEELKLDNSVLKDYKVDVLLHCGDFTNWGNPEHLEAFNTWLGGLDLPKERKLIICGNHDSKVTFELKHKFKVDFEKHLNNGTLLCKEYGSSVSIEGLKIAGIPYSNPRVPDPDFWLEQFSADTHVLLTHNAIPKTSLCSAKMGSMSLKQAVKQHFEVRSKDNTSDFLHCFGHVHDKHGFEESFSKEKRKLLMLNAANVSHNRKVAYNPIYVKCQNSSGWKFHILSS